MLLRWIYRHRNVDAPTYIDDSKNTATLKVFIRSGYHVSNDNYTAHVMRQTVNENIKNNNYR